MYISLPDRSIDDLMDAEDRFNWFLATIQEREGQDYSKSGLELEELEGIWNDLEKAQGKASGDGHAPTPADKLVSVTGFIWSSSFRNVAKTSFIREDAVRGQGLCYETEACRLPTTPAQSSPSS